VPIMPWGAADAQVQKCGEFVQWRESGRRIRDLSPYRAPARPDPWFRSRFRIAVTHQMHEFLRGRFVAATAIAVLQRHCATNLDRLFRPRIWIVDPRRERAVTSRQIFNDPLAAFARGFLANIDVAIAHDQNPFECIATRGYSEKLQIVRSSRPERCFGSRSANPRAAFPPEKG
jgi:hypothetical protein